MIQIEQLIHCRWLLPIAPENIILENHSIALEKGKILAFGPTNQMNHQYVGKQTLKLDNHVVLPGFVNCHTHAAMNLYRGMADDVSFVHWLNKSILPAEKTICSPEAILDGSKLAVAEMLRTGTTCFNDHYFMPNLTAKLARELNIRACLGLQIYNVENQWAKDADDAINKGISLYQHAEKHELNHWLLAPHAPYSVTDDNFRRIKQLSDQYNLRIHIHLCESEAENQHSFRQYQCRPIERMNKLGLINEKLIAVHMLFVNQAEIELCAAQHVNIVHCPESNMKLANGFAPITQYMNQGINVALGTDGVASNNDLDMLGEARTASFAAKAINQNPETLSALELLKMMTLNGAIAVGLDSQIGSIEPGKSADIIAVDLSDPLTQPVYNPASHLIYCASKTQVSDVWVAGKKVLDRGEFTIIDKEELKQIANKWQPKVVAALQNAQSIEAL